MKKLVPYIFLCLLSGVWTSCVKKVNVDIRNEKAKLVVEGFVSNDSTAYTVSLGYSGNFSFADDIPPENRETNALVSINDDLGHQYLMTHLGNGLYQTIDPNFIGQVGRSYSINIQLPNGTTYISKPETIQPVIPFNKISAAWINDFNLEHPTYLNMYIDADDPASEENYYRWTFDSYIMRETRGVPCGFFCVNYVFCYQKQFETDVKILSDAAINGQAIRNQLVGKCYIYTYGNPYIEVKQHAISRGAYQFLERYQDQLVRTGGILDPLPASIKGNVYNKDNPADFALGYFSAESVYKKKLIVIPYSITDYLLNISAKSFVPEQTIACFDYYPNSIPYPSGPFPPPPPGWENADQLKVYW